MHQLDGPRLKLDWAAKHLAVLDAEVIKFQAEHPYPIRQKIDPETGKPTMIVQPSSEADPEIALIAGDVIHNLRTALDHLYWQLVLVSGHIPGRDAFFPIWEQEPAISVRAAMRELLKDGAAETIEALQPYNSAAGKIHFHPLANLHRLDIIDKHHRMIIATEAFHVEVNFDRRAESDFLARTPDAVFLPSAFQGSGLKFDAKAEAILAINFERADGTKGSVSLGQNGELRAILDYVRTMVFEGMEGLFLHD